jgi:DNA-binding NarL/FixJ family response regulator
MRILIADDNQMIRRGIAAILANDQSLIVCGEAADAEETLQKACDLRPDVVLLDVSMPGTNGLETARLLRQRVPDSKVLIISQHDADQLLPRSLEVGAVGCVDKVRLAADLLPALRKHVPQKSV